MSLGDFAELFQGVAFFMMVFVVPHSVVCLFLYRKHPAIIYAKTHKDSGYWWSIMTWTWYVKLSTSGLFVLFVLYFIRVFSHYDVIVQDLPPQPEWSYLLSMFVTVILVIILWMPSFFYLYVKHAVRHDRRIRRLVYEERQKGIGGA